MRFIFIWVFFSSLSLLQISTNLSKLKKINQYKKSRTVKWCKRKYKPKRIINKILLVKSKFYCCTCDTSARQNRAKRKNNNQTNTKKGIAYRSNMILLTGFATNEEHLHSKNIFKINAYDCVGTGKLAYAVFHAFSVRLSKWYHQSKQKKKQLTKNYKLIQP